MQRLRFVLGDPLAQVWDDDDLEDYLDLGVDFYDTVLDDLEPDEFVPHHDIVFWWAVNCAIYAAKINDVTLPAPNVEEWTIQQLEYLGV